MTKPAAPQLSVAVTLPVKLGTAAWQLPFAFALCPGAHTVMFGAVTSVTVKVVVQVFSLSAASVTLIVTFVTPVPTSVPAAGDCVITRSSAAVQLSVAVTLPVKSGTAAWQLPFASALCAGAHTVMFGAVTSATVKVVVQVFSLSAASVTLIVTFVTPVPTSVPAAGDCVITRSSAAVQLSVAVTLPVKSGTAAWQLPFASALCAGAHTVMFGAVTSATVKVVVQVFSLSAASVTLIVTFVTPVPTSVPAAGDCVITRSSAAVQLSVAVTLPVKSGTAAWQLAFASALLAGAHAVMIGAVTSATVKVVVQVDELLAASFTVIVMLVVPVPTSVPAAGDWVMTKPAAPQLSVAVTLPVKLGTAAWQLPFASALLAGAHAVMFGAVTSVTVKVVVQVDALLAASFTVIVTFVVPVPTSVPAAGDCVMTKPAAPQLSVAVTLPLKSGTAA
jgi:hypothetical protein